MPSQTSGWFGQIIQRSDRWRQNLASARPETRRSPPRPPKGMPVAESNKFAYNTNSAQWQTLTTHQWYDGTQHPWEFKARLAPRALAERSGNLLRRRRRCRTFPHHRRRQKLDRAFRPARAILSGAKWAPGAGGMGLHTIVLKSQKSKTDFHRHLLGRKLSAATMKERPGKLSPRACTPFTSPTPPPEVGHCVHRIAMHPAKPNVLFHAEHWDVMRT